MIDSGFVNSGYIENMGQALVAIAIVLILLLLISPLLLSNCCRERLKKKLRSFKDEMFWNGIINSFTVEYLNHSKYWFALTQMDIQEAS